MAVSSLSAAFVLPLSLSNSSPSLSSKPKFPSLYFLSGNTLRLTTPKPLHSSTVVYAAPEVLDSAEPVDPPQQTPDVESENSTLQIGELETTSTSSISIGAEADMGQRHQEKEKLGQTNTARYGSPNNTTL